MIAQIESWESAAEFGIPEDQWAAYQVKDRTDDLYITAISAIFESLRIEDQSQKASELNELAKTLLIFSQSAASKYISGVANATNLLYCGSCYYLAGFPATAALISKSIDPEELSIDQELFLLRFLSSSFDTNFQIDAKFLNAIKSNADEAFTEFLAQVDIQYREGIESDANLFISAKLSQECLQRYRSFNIWNILRKHAPNFDIEVWRPFLESKDGFAIRELFPSQKEVIENGLLDDTNEVYSMQMPTSSGKTSLCEILIYSEVKSREKSILFLVPFRALASEIRDGMSERLKSAGISVIASHGGNIPSRTEGATIETADVLIVTPEKFTALSYNMPEIINRFETVIFDEGHLLDDENRGLQYELLLSKLKSDAAIKRKMVFISAILPNIDVIHEWLGGNPNTLTQSEYKPVDIDYAILAKTNKSSWQLNFNTIYEQPRSYFLLNFITTTDFEFLNERTQRLNTLSNKPNYLLLSCASALKARKHGAVAVFTTQKGKSGVSGIAKTFLNFFAKNLHVANHDFVRSQKLQDLIQYISIQLGDDHQLKNLLGHGIGYHHGDLPQEIRREMEFAIQNNLIDILICTSTLAEGVNLPIRTLIVHTIKRFNGKIIKPIKLRSIKNIVGRVGRAGKESRGRIIFVNSGERQIAEQVFRNKNMENATGALFELIRLLDSSVRRLNIDLSNEIFEAQQNSFLKILDRIDIAIIDLLPEQHNPANLEAHIQELIENTLAYKFCDTDALRERFQEIFQLRSKHFQESVPEEDWSTLKNSGVSPRYWQFCTKNLLLQNEQWLTLSDALDENWIRAVIFPISKYPQLELSVTEDLLLTCLTMWMQGFTYIEIAEICPVKVNEILKILGTEIGFKLHDAVSKIIQLSLQTQGEENVSEMARNWASLLQYGLCSLQQLDLFERGATDRLGVWGIYRFLQNRGTDLRGPALLGYIRSNAAAMIASLQADPRVPTLSTNRIVLELGLQLPPGNDK